MIKFKHTENDIWRAIGLTKAQEDEIDNAYKDFVRQIDMDKPIDAKPSKAIEFVQKMVKPKTSAQYFYMGVGLMILQRAISQTGAELLSDKLKDAGISGIEITVERRRKGLFERLFR